MKDSDGTYNIREIVKTGKQKGGGWADMKVLNPANGKVEHKTSFCRAGGDIVVGCGVYK